MSAPLWEVFKQGSVKHKTRLRSSVPGILRASGFPLLTQLWEAMTISLPPLLFPVLPSYRVNLQTLFLFMLAAGVWSLDLTREAWPEGPESPSAGLCTGHSGDPQGDWDLGSALRRIKICLLSQMYFVLIAFPPI